MSAKNITGSRLLDVSFRTDLSAEELASLWRKLEALAHPSFFLSWRWIGCWLRQTGLSPNVLMVHRGDRLIGMALLQSGKGDVFPDSGARYLTASGNRDFDSIFVEYNGFLCAPVDSFRVGQAVQDFLACRKSQRDGWKRLNLPGVSQETLALWSHGPLVVRVEISRPAPFIDLKDLRGRHNDYLASRSGNCRQQIRRSIRLYQSESSLELQVASSLTEARAIFDELKSLHQLSWRARGQPGAFAIPFFEQFHRALIDDAWPAGQIDLIRIHAGERTVGCLYNFLHDGNAYAYQSGFKYDEDPRYKPGLVAHAMAAERYLSLGIDRYLLLAGDSRYKTSLATGSDMLYWLAVRRKGLRSSMEEWAGKAVRKVAGFRD